MPNFDWTSGDSGDWSTGADWAGGIAPSLSSANVTISGASDVSIADGESYTVDSVTLGSGSPQLDVYGFLSRGGTSHTLLVQSGLVYVDGGTLANMKIQVSGGELDLQNATLDGVSYSGTINKTDSDELFIENGLTAAGGVMNLYGGPDGDAGLIFEDSETLNNQTIVLGGSDNGAWRPYAPAPQPAGSSAMWKCPATEPWVCTTTIL